MNSKIKLNGTKKHIMFILLGIICSFISCNKPIPFNKEKWKKHISFEGHEVYGNTRYRMALWMEKNYAFCDKSLYEICEELKFTDWPFGIELIKEAKKTTIVTKQYNPNFMTGIDPNINTDWIEIFFDEDYMVSKVYYVHYNRKTREKTERKICGK